MKTITEQTVLKKGDKTFKGVNVDGVIYWVDESFKDATKLLKNNGILFYSENGEKEVFNYDEHDGYGLGVYDLKKQRCTIRQSACCLIVAQSEPKLEGVSVVNLDKYIEKLAESKYDLSDSHDTWAYYGFVNGYKSNSNQYTQKDIEKAIILAWNRGAKENFQGKTMIYDSDCFEIIEQINNISIIEIDEQFNILNYE